MLVATCSCGVIGGHQQVDLASAGNWPDLIFVFFSLFVVSLFGWVVVILLMMVDGGFR